MKNLVRVSSFIFAILLFTNLFTSCKKDEVIEPTPEVTTTPTVVSHQITVLATRMMTIIGIGGMSTNTTDYCECFAIFDNVDWGLSEAEVKGQLETILAGLTEQQLEELFTPVCTPDGDSFMNACVATCNGVTNFEACIDYHEDDWNECFSFVYPISVVFPDVGNVEVNSDEELITSVEDWYEANPNADDGPAINYPVSVLLQEDGSLLAINDDDQLDDLFEYCDEDDDFECFTFNWPLSIQFPDSSIVEINSLDEGEDIVEAWYTANPNVDEDVELVFPFDVILEDGTVQTINDEDEFNALVDDCEGDWDGGCLVQDTSNALVQGIRKMRN